MDVGSYARPLLKRWYVVALLAALAAAAAFASSARAPRVYRATAHLSVTPTSIDFFKGEAVQRLLNSYALELRSDDFAGWVAARLQPPAAAEQLAGRIRAVAAPADFRIGIEVDDADPARAQAIANAAALGFVDKIRDEVAGNERWEVQVQVLDRAKLPASPIGPRPKRDALGAAILGALIGAGLAFLLEFWDDTMRSSEEAARLLALPALGAIPPEKKNGVIDGFWRRWSARRGRLHPAALAGRGGVSDAAH
jgi:capsular polysaccharide biosynthesis protein